MLLDAHLLRGIHANLNLRPLTRAAFFFFAVISILDLDEKTPLAQLGKRKRGPVEAGKGSPASEPTELSTQDIRVASPKLFGAASPTILSHDSKLGNGNQRYPS